MLACCVWILAINIAVLKFIVIALGVLILVGTSVIGITIVSRLQHISSSDVDTVSAELTPIHIATGSQVKSIDVEDGILFLHLDTSEGVVVIGYDLSTGQKISEMAIGQKP